MEQHDEIRDLFNKSEYKLFMEYVREESLIKLSPFNIKDRDIPPLYVLYSYVCLSEIVVTVRTEYEGISLQFDIKLSVHIIESIIKKVRREDIIEDLLDYS